MDIKGFSPRSLNSALNDKQKNFNKLSSGSRINSAADDAAGLAIVAALESDVRSSAQAVRNISDGVSAAQIADGALGQVSDLYSRNAELATQAANGTLSDEQRGTLNQEYQQNLQEIDRISQTTQFNGQQLLSGGNSISLQVGTDSSSNSQISLQLQNVATAPSDISTQANAQSALDSSKQSIEGIAAQRGQIGAAVNRLDAAQNSNLSKIEGEQAAASRIRDVDFAEETAKLVANDIRAQSGLAVLAQANVSKSQVLKLLS